MFGIADYGAYCAAILMFLMLPGPGTFTLLSATAQGGMRAGATATAGVIVGDQVLKWLAVAGVAALLSAHPTWFRATQWLGAAYLGWIGLRLLLARGEESAAPVSIRPHHYLRQALLITLLNPKAIIFYMAFFPLFIDPATHLGWPTFAAMGLTVAAITALYGLSALAHRVAARLRAQRRLARALERLAGLFLIGFGVRLLRD